MTDKIEDLYMAFDARGIGLVGAGYVVVGKVPFGAGRMMAFFVGSTRVMAQAYIDDEFDETAGVKLSILKMRVRYNPMKPSEEMLKEHYRGLQGLDELQAILVSDYALECCVSTYYARTELGLI